MAIAVRVRACFVNFYEVGAFLELLTNDRHEFGGVVRISGVGENVLLGIVAVSVFMTTKNVDGVAADAQARPGDCAMIDGIAHSRSAEPAPSVPISRSAVKPAIKSSRAPTAR